MMLIEEEREEKRRIKGCYCLYLLGDAAAVTAGAAAGGDDNKVELGSLSGRRGWQHIKKNSNKMSLT